MVLQAVEEPPQCFAVCAAGLAAGSPLSHHQVADGLTFPATVVKFSSDPQMLLMLTPPSNLPKSLYLNILSSHPFLSPHHPIPKFEIYITPSQF
jgi:hypothetical protein